MAEFIVIVVPNPSAIATLAHHIDFTINAPDLLAAYLRAEITIEKHRANFESNFAKAAPTYAFAPCVAAILPAVLATLKGIHTGP